MMSVFLTTYQGAILGPIARLLGYILQGIYSVLSTVGIENTGICMILFTFIVNALMIPMQIKQQKFAKMSSVMNPELMAIQAKYKNKKDQESQQKMSLETQAVYQKYGVSPVSGCLPMLITLPILFALYRVIYNIPGKAQVTVFTPNKRYFDGELPVTQFGTTECLIDNLFNKKVNTRVIFNPNTGGIVKIDKD